MEKQHITKDQWTGLPSDVRSRLRKTFSLPISEAQVVDGNRVVSDGVSDTTLRSVFSVQRMSEYLGVEGDCDFLFQKIAFDDPTPADADNRDAAEETPKPKARKKRTSK